MARLSDIVAESDAAVYDDGRDDGFWSGWMAGAEAQRRYIMGESESNPYGVVPSEHLPLGDRWTHPIVDAEGRPS